MTAKRARPQGVVVMGAGRAAASDHPLHTPAGVLRGPLRCLRPPLYGAGGLPVYPSPYPPSPHTHPGTPPVHPAECSAHYTYAVLETVIFRGL